MIPFLMDFLIKMAIYFTIMYLTGLMVLKKGVKVNYTRKINHFSLLAVPFLLGVTSRGESARRGRRYTRHYGQSSMRTAPDTAPRSSRIWSSSS